MIEEAAARRVCRWLDDGCPSWGVPEAEIRKLAQAHLTKPGELERVAIAIFNRGKFELSWELSPEWLKADAREIARTAIDAIENEAWNQSDRPLTSSTDQPNLSA